MRLAGVFVKVVELEVIIKWVDFYRGKITQKKVLETLNVSKTTYYRWKKQIPMDREDSKLVKLVKTLCEENKFRYGYCKITYIVNKEMKVNKNTV